MPSRGHSTTSIPRPRPSAPATDDRGARRSGPKTDGIGSRRKRGAAASKKGRVRAGRDGAKGGTAPGDRRRDLTKAIPVERRLVESRRKQWAVIGAVGVLFTAFAAALFVLPFQAWQRQQADIERKQRELAALERANAELNEEVAKLNTPEGIEEAAREEIGYVRRGEIQLTVLPLPAAPTDLPSGWPFDAAARILTLRGGTASSTGDGPGDQEPSQSVVP